MGKNTRWRFSEDFGQVDVIGSGQVIVDQRDQDLSDKEMRLIAAAPELLTATELARDLLELILPIIRETNPEMAIKMIDMRDTVTMLIIKATGETIEQRAAREKDED